MDHQRVSQQSLPNHPRKDVFLKPQGVPPRKVDARSEKSVSEKWNQLYEDLLPPHANDEDVQSVLFECSKGTHKLLWYKFKRFESLALLNLYHYQHELTVLEAEINSFKPASSEKDEVKKPGVMSGEQINRMRRLVKEYSKAILLFRDIALVKRPSMEERKATAKILKENLHESHYTEAADAYGMLTLDPTSLGVEADGIRVFLTKMVTRLRSNPWVGPQYHDDHILGPTITSKAHLSHEDHEHAQVLPPDWNQTADVETGRPDSQPELGKTDEGIQFQVRLPDGTQDKEITSKREIILFAGRPYQIPITSDVEAVVRLLLAIIAAIVLLAPMLALSFISSQSYQLMTTALFVLLFSAILSFSSKATNQELMVAVAAYAAVLVVFIGQNSAR